MKNNFYPNGNHNAHCMRTEHEDFGVVRPAAADPFCSYQDHAKLDFASVATDAPAGSQSPSLPPLCHLMGANNGQPTAAAANVN